MDDLPSSLHFQSDHTGPCCQCGKQTDWIDLCFEAWLCPGDCTIKAWEEFNAAWEASIDERDDPEEEDGPFPTIESEKI